MKTEKRILIAYGFPYSSDGKESACNAGDLGSIPGSGRSPGEENGNPFPGKFHRQRSLAGYSLWGCRELDRTKQLTHTTSIHIFLATILSSFFVIKYSALILNTHQGNFYLNYDQKKMGFF